MPPVQRLSALLPWAAFVCLCLSGPATQARAALDKTQPMNDGMFLIFVDEGHMLTDSGAPPNHTQPDLFISMPHVMLAGQELQGSPSSPLEERECAAACRARAADGCNTYRYCPLQEGCSASLLNGSATSGAAMLAHRHCVLMSQPGALPQQGHPPEALDKGPTIAMTSGQLVPDMRPPDLAGYQLHMCLGWYNMYDYTCAGTLKEHVCMRQGSLEEAEAECNADGVRCMGIKWFPLGRDFLGPNIYMLKGIPDSPTTQNLPAVPIDLSLANWNGDVVFYAKAMNDSQLAAARAYLPGATADDGDSDGGGLSGGAIAGIVAGTVLAVGFLVGALLLWRRRHVRELQLVDAEKGSGGGGGSGGSSSSGDGSKVLDSVMQLHPGRLTAADMTSMYSSATPTPDGRGSLSDGTATASSGGSIDSVAVAGELGKEWLLDVSQLTFEMNSAGEPRELGSGGQGTVYKALLNGVEPVAAKVIVVGANPDAQQQWMAEARMLRRLRHRNMVHFVGVALHGCKAVILTEFMEGRDFFAALSMKDKATGQRIFSWYRRGGRVALDVASALTYLHHQRVVHFDVKSSNVLLTRDLTAKLGDVGLSRLLTHTQAPSRQEAVGTFAWCAPEVLMGHRSSFPSDIYSFGILLWEICTGEVPRRGRIEMPRVPEQCPQELADLMMRCLDSAPEKRPTAAQLVEELSRLTGAKLHGGKGVMSGADGLEHATSGDTTLAGSSEGELPWGQPLLHPASPEPPAPQPSAASDNSGTAPAAGTPVSPPMGAGMRVIACAAVPRGTAAAAVSPFA